MNSQNETEFEQLPSDLMLKINQLCDQFESELKQGNLPLISAYLDDVAFEYREIILKELVSLEVVHRYQRGEKPESSEYLRKYPALDQEWISTVVQNSRSEKDSISIQEKNQADQRMTSHFSLDEYIAKITETGIVTEHDLSDLIRSQEESRRPDTAEALSALLIQAGKLTQYQNHVLCLGGESPLLIGDYLILEPIGSGGMGTVYKAVHKRMKRIVALKVIRSDMDQLPDRLKRFEREVQTAARLSHPNIMTAYDAGEDQGVHYLICEYIDGESLTELVRSSGPLDFSDAMNCILQIAHGLAYAHGQGVIHRDIKPANILIDDQGDLKILDMGLARLQQTSEDLLVNGSQTELTTSQFFMGTIDYMAPEQARNTKLADHRSDIYSLGCTLYFLLTAKPVYDGETTVERILAHKEQPIPSLSAIGQQISDKFDPIFAKMLAKEPDDRYRSAEELIQDLEKFSSEYLQDQTFTLPVTGKNTGAKTSQNWSGAPTRIQPVDPSLTVMAARNQEEKKEGVTKYRALIGGSLASVVVILTGLFLWNPSDSPKVSSNSDGDKQYDVPPLNQFTVLEAQEYQQQFAEQSKLPVRVTVNLGEQGDQVPLDLILIPPREFMMRNSTESQTADDFIPHRVKITKPYYMSSTEITYGHFRHFVKATGYQTDAERGGGYGMEGGTWQKSNAYSWKNLGELPLSDQMPASSISWNDAVAFCQWLSKTTGEQYRLPTEAEWENACRAGSQTAWFFGTDPGEMQKYAWFLSNAENKINRVKLKLPNPYGLYDIYGNEWEWCQDYYSTTYYSESPVENPTGPVRGSERVQRGGGFQLSLDQFNSYIRGHGNPQSPLHGAFRVVREVNSD